MDSFEVPTRTADHQLQQHGQYNLAGDPPLSVELTDIISLSGLFELPNSEDRAKDSTATSRTKESITGIETRTHTRDHAIAHDHKHHSQSEKTAKQYLGKWKNRKPQAHRSSEKRRRDKIEGKMKVLRQLVPNSHQLDKASLLDRAISYVKTLKSQVQMMQHMMCPSVHSSAPGTLQCPMTNHKPIPLVPVPMPITFGWTTGTNYASSSQLGPYFQPFLPGNGRVSAGMPFQSMALSTSLQATRADDASATPNSVSSFMDTVQSVVAEDNLSPFFQNYPSFN